MDSLAWLRRYCTSETMEVLDICNRVLSLHDSYPWLSIQRPLLYAIPTVQPLCSNVRFLPRKYYACQIFSFIYLLMDG
jgi:hypothetical protein